MNQPRFTIYSDGWTPLAHRPTLAAAVEAATYDGMASFILDRVQRRAFTRDGTPLRGIPA